MELIGKTLVDGITKLRFAYHAEMLDVNKVLNDLGLISDEQHEESNKKHVMTLINDVFPKMFPHVDIEKALEQFGKMNK